MLPELTQHHIGCLVESIEKFKAENQNIFVDDAYTKEFNIPSQNVKVCFINTGNGILLEMVEPSAENKWLQKMYKKGMVYYHIGYISSQYNETLKTLLSLGYIKMEEFISEAFNNKRACFFYHPQLQWIEIIEA